MLSQKLRHFKKRVKPLIEIEINKFLSVENSPSPSRAEAISERLFTEISRVEKVINQIVPNFRAKVQHWTLGKQLRDSRFNQSQLHDILNEMKTKIYINSLRKTRKSLPF